MPAKKTTPKSIHVKRITAKTLNVFIRGTAPLILNRMPEKARLALLAGGGGKKQKRSGAPKHDPLAEFVSSMQREPGYYPDTDIVFPAVAFKNAMATAAIYSDSVNKTDIKRLIYLPNEWAPIYGVPQLRLDVMRQAGMSRTPDIRTRAIIPEWGTRFQLDYLPPMSHTAILTLLTNAGVIAGIGDSRQELGKGSFGTFELVNKGDLPEMDLAAQRAAIESPVAFNPQSRDLLELFHEEMQRRE